MVVIKKLNDSLEKIHVDKDGYFHSSKFFDLESNIRINSRVNNMTIDKKYENLYHHLLIIETNLSNIVTILHRLDWQRELRLRGDLSDALWMDFTQCDIDHFHVEYRSIFDCLAKAIVSILDNPNGVPKSSFSDLKKWVSSEKNVQRNIQILGKDFAKLVTSCNWFDEIKDIRDLRVHKRGSIIVYLPKDVIGFQIHEGKNYKKKIAIRELMYNENVVNFELYAGLYMGYLISYLEQAAESIDKQITLTNYDGHVRSYHYG